jgi:hypothetical protein
LFRISNFGFRIFFLGLLAVVVLSAVLPALAAPRRGGGKPPIEPPKGTGPLDEYTPRVDAAVEKGLKYLAGQARPDGAFGTARNHSTATTSLSVMAFLAKGYTPRVGPYADIIDKGIDYIIASQRPDGLLDRDGRAWYCHTISTLMLSEVSGMVDPERQKRLDAALAKALKLILTAQAVRKDPQHQGGWRYEPTSGDSDISCTGWSLMALRSARNNGAAVPKEAIDAATAYILRCHAGNGGFAYQPGGPAGLARTGTGLLCLELVGSHGQKITTDAGKWILGNLPSRYGADHFYYGLYYCSQAMFQLGDDYWTAWGRFMYEMMLKFHSPDGSWPEDPSAGAGPCYSTSMAILALSVSFRQLPIYQR